MPAKRLEVEHVKGHQLIRGPGGVIAVLYETHSEGLFSPSWERELDLQHTQPYILWYRAKTFLIDRTPRVVCWYFAILVSIFVSLGQCSVLTVDAVLIPYRLNIIP